MKEISKLNIEFLKLVSLFPNYKWQITDFYFKNYYDDFLTAFLSSQGRKFTLFCNNVAELRSQLKKLLLISDKIMFNINNYSAKPFLTAFPIDGETNNLMIFQLEDTKDKTTFIPSAHDLMTVFDIAALDEKLYKNKEIFLGYDFDKPDQSWQRSNFALSSLRNFSFFT
ncbi:MAG: hypothetical protein IIC75_03545 [Bacteroidetes bacterium]|nr:hypothetical protein [Bacteroidota bacterium]